MLDTNQTNAGFKRNAEILSTVANGVESGNSDQSIWEMLGNLSLDTARSPIAATTAVIAEAGTAIANLPLTLLGMDKLEVNDTLSAIADYTGYDDPIAYYKAHKDFTDFTSLFVGGSLGFKAGTALASKLLNGVFTVTADTGQISRLVAAERQLKELTKTADISSDIYLRALKSRNIQLGISDVSKAVTGNLVFDLVMIQHPLMEHYGLTDFIISSAVGATFGLGLQTLPAISRSSKALTSSIAAAEAAAVGEILTLTPLGVKGTPMEAVYLQAKNKQIAKALATDASMPAGTANRLEFISQRNEAEQIKLLDKVIDDPIRVDTGVNKADWPAHKRDLRDSVHRIVLNTETNTQLAGVTKIAEVNPLVQKALVADDPFDYILIHNNRPATRLTDAELKVAFRTKQLAGSSVDELAAEFGMTKKLANNMFDLNNVALLDTRTHTIHSLDEAKSLITSVEAGIVKVESGTSVFHGKQEQVHYNMIQAATEGRGLAKLKLDSVNRTINGRDRPLDAIERIYIHEFILAGGKLSGKLTNRQFLDFHGSQIKKDIESLLLQGKDLSEISVRLNLDLTELSKVVQGNKLIDKAIGEFATQGDKVGLNGLSLIRAAGAKAWEAETKPRVFALHGDIAKQETRVKQMATLDRQGMTDLIAEERAKLVNEANSPLLDQLQAVLGDSGLALAIKEKLSQFGLNPATFRGGRTLSSDMQLRAEAVLPELLRSGGAINKILQDYLREHTKSINVALVALGRDNVNRVRWNTSLAAIRSAKPAANETVVVFGNKLGITNSTLGEVSPENFKELALADGKALGELPEEVISFWKDYNSSLNGELFRLQNFLRVANGGDALVSKGLKAPPINLIQKFRAYIPITEDNTVMIFSDTKHGLEELILQAKKKYPDKPIITSGSDAKYFNIIEGHIELDRMNLARFDKGKTSTSFDTVSALDDQIGEFQAGLFDLYRRLANRSAKILTSDTYEFLRIMDEATTVGVEQKLGTTSVFKAAEKTMYGESSLHLDDVWSKADTVFTAGLAKGLSIGKAILGNAPLQSAIRLATLGKKGDMHNLQSRVIETLKDLEAAGIENPWGSLNTAVAQTQAYKLKPKLAETAVANLNFATGTLALRFLEAAHPIVTMLSVPITTMPEISAAMGAGGHGAFMSNKVMMEAVHRAFSKSHEEYFKALDAKGITNAQVSENTERIRDMVTKPGFIQTLDDSKFFKRATMLSDGAEHIARRVAASAGSIVYEQMHGVGSHLTASGEAFVDLFTKRAMGNYTTVQRPIIFQGTLGAAIGLFQTYTWTMAQNVYRYLEVGNPGVVAQLMATQGAVFGLASLPGFSDMNYYIGSHYGNPTNQDITSTIYQQFGDIKSSSVGNEEFTVAETMLYGAPATLFNTALYTRGILNPRSPVNANDQLNGVNFAVAGIAPVTTAFTTMAEVYSRVKNGMGLGDSMVAGLQLQQLSRPLSRLADFVAGDTIDRNGQVVDPDATFALDLATFTRLSSARPLREQLIRDLGYQNSYYNKTNSSHKKEIIKTIRGLLQSGDFTEEASAKLFRAYTGTGGSPEGFRSNINLARLGMAEGKAALLDDQIRDDSALRTVYAVVGH